MSDLRERIGRIPITKKVYHVQIDDKKQLQLLTIHGKYFQNKIQDMVRQAILQNWIDYISELNVPKDEESLKDLNPKTMCRHIT